MFGDLLGDCDVLLTAAALAGFCVSLVLAAEEDWSASVKFPAGEKPVKLFNGKDFNDWGGGATRDPRRG